MTRRQHCLALSVAVVLAVAACSPPVSPGPSLEPLASSSPPVRATPDGSATPALTASAMATQPYVSTIDEVPPDVAIRSSWREECPVGLDELRYLTMTYWGFDKEAHTGEMMVHADIAHDVAGVFESLYEERFPITEMRIYTFDEVTNPGYGNEDNTSAFECRAVVGSSTGWSQHAYGLALDINPFENPYIHGDLLLPSGAAAYVDRENARPGMILEGDTAVSGFDAVGWYWGGRWTELKDYMHFSVSGG